MNPVLQYLRQVAKFRQEHLGTPEGYAYTCMEDYVFQNGKEHQAAPLDPDEVEIVRAAVDHATHWEFDVHETKQCFANSQLLVLHDKSGELVYTEGYAQGLAVLCIHHGWVTINGKVVDPTWVLKTPADRDFLPQYVLGEFPETYAYVGVPFENRHYIRSRITARGAVGSLIDDWKADYPLLRGS